MARRAHDLGAVAAGLSLCLASARAVAGSAPTASSAPREQIPEPNEAQLDWEQPIGCLPQPQGGVLYAQCDHARKICLYHDGCLTGTSGPGCVGLERTKGCTAPPEPQVTQALLEARGYRFVRARAEAPNGWMRDERGRVFQVEFDMNRRIWLGARWLPGVGQGGRQELGRAGLELGLRAETLSDDTRLRHRFHVLNGELTLNPLAVDAMLLRYDASKESEHPLMRVTTFWPPARHDLFMNIGPWVDLLGVELRPRGSEDETHLRFAGAGLVWDLWHAPELTSFARLRLGAAAEDLYVDRPEVGHRLALTPVAHLETDVMLGRAGMHRVTVAAGYEPPLVWDKPGEAAPEARHRFRGEAAYELIVLAINDQPVTVRMAAEGGYRTDVEQGAGWDLRGGLGLRFNLWAPGPPGGLREQIREARGE